MGGTGFISDAHGTGNGDTSKMLDRLAADGQRFPNPSVVTAMGYSAPRDTRAGSAGHAMHRALETAAVNLGEQLVRKRAPELRGAYQRWRARWGVSASLLRYSSNCEFMPPL